MHVPRGRLSSAMVIILVLTSSWRLSLKTRFDFREVAHNILIAFEVVRSGIGR